MPDDLKNLEKEVLEHLNKLDVETLSILEKYSEEHAKSQRVQTLISTVIATIAGAAVTSTYVFPDLDTTIVGGASAVFGVVLAYFALRERRKEHSELIRSILEKDINLSSIDVEIKKKEN
ncbi:hypothetical protein [Vibrio furnissii]|uniref:hypothetical protein n=1 Tax=Vibrio furnissii TaxID=29494 RepID=UPI001EECAA45|nr:hypothetical protein [Vibrio furnissii]MCG6214719.1 hypothetical protein [Vibrio furnissii]